MRSRVVTILKYYFLIVARTLNDKQEGFLRTNSTIKDVINSIAVSQIFIPFQLPPIERSNLSEYENTHTHTLL